MLPCPSQMLSLISPTRYELTHLNGNGKMNSNRIYHLSIVSFGLLIVTSCFNQTVFGQLQTRTLAKHAVLIVDGQVVDVFQSAAFKEQFLVKILVQKSEAIRLEKMNASIRFPAPGENIYVHVNRSNTSSKRNNRISPDLPKPNMTIRAVLHSGDHQEWVGKARDWYQEFGQDSALTNPISRQLGVSTEIAFYGGKAALKVVNVAGGSPAQLAGIEPGMLILTADGKPLAKPENLVKAEREAKGILLIKLFEPKSRDERTVRVDLR